MPNEIKWTQKALGVSQNVKNTPPQAWLLPLFKGNGTEAIEAPSDALPKGYNYAAYVSQHRFSPITGNGGTVAYHAHPSDISADFGPFLIYHIQELGEKFSQVLVTRGENGSRGLGEDIVTLRLQEEINSAGLHNINVEFLTRKEGGYFSDGELMKPTELAALTARIKKDIVIRKPHRIILPSPWPDHPDHLAINLAGMHAVSQLEEEGYFKKNPKIEIITCEPEFGVAAGHPRKLKDIPALYGGMKADGADDFASVPHFPYKYKIDEAGRVSPASDIAITQDPELSDIAGHPFAVAPFIVTVPNEIALRQITALLHHHSQMKGTNYLKLITAFAHVRGDLVGKEWGVGVYPIHIDGATPEGNPFIDSLPEGCVFQLQKERPGHKISAEDRIRRRIGTSGYEGFGASAGI